MKDDLIIIGAGGHARVLIGTLLSSSTRIIGLTDPMPEKAGREILGLPVIGDDEILQKYPPESVTLVNGVGATTSTAQRQALYERLNKKGYRFACTIHPTAILGVNVHLSEGVQIMAGAIIQTGCSIGENTIINTGAIVDHDCSIGAHVHLAPGTTLSGGVHIGSGAYIGSSATIIQNINVGAASLVAAGSVVVSNIPAGAKAMGVPAKIIEGRE